MKKRDDPQFYASMIVKVWTRVPLRAQSFVDAIAEAKTMNVDDLCEAVGDVNDHSILVESISDDRALDGFN